MILTQYESFEEFYDSIPLEVKIVIYVLLGILLFTLILMGIHSMKNSVKLSNMGEYDKLTLGMSKKEVINTFNMKPDVINKNTFIYEWRKVHLNCDYDFIRITLQFKNGALVDMNKEKGNVIIDRSKYTFK